MTEDLLLVSRSRASSVNDLEESDDLVESDPQIGEIYQHRYFTGYRVVIATIVDRSIEFIDLGDKTRWARCMDKTLFGLTFRLQQ